MKWKPSKRTAKIAAVIVAVCAICWFFACYLIVEWHVYPRNRSVLDLRDRPVTLELYEELHPRMPNTAILWKVPFQGKKVSSDVKSLTIKKLSEEDFFWLDYFPRLKTIHAESCKDYPLLLKLQEERPKLKVLYNVTIHHIAYPQDAKSIRTASITPREVELLQWLPKLEKLDLNGCEDYPLLLQLYNDRPGQVSYSVAFGSQKIPVASTNAQIKRATNKQLTENLAFLPNLEKLQLIDPKATGEELLALRKTYPDLDIHWTIHAYDQTLTDDITELDISGNILESTDEAETLAAYFPQLEKLIMSDCGIKNDVMGAFREKMRSNYKVVWTVYFGHGRMAVRTDETSFMPWKGGIPVFQEYDVPALCYCEDMVTVDVGHGELRSCTFAAYMPHLKYLILAHTNVNDITPLTNCKELIFLELDYTYQLLDYSPLVELTALEDLNMGWNATSCEPISKMTWLKNLWWNSYNDPTVISTLKKCLPNTHLEFYGLRSVDNGWRKLPNYYAMRDNLGMFYDS